MASIEKVINDKEPRAYQLEMLEYIKQRNAIIYLPTGSGKTFIAILAIRSVSEQLEGNFENGAKRVVFMCNTVELARQQLFEIQSYTNLNVGLYVGERKGLTYRYKRWEESIKRHQVLVGTAQMFVHMILEGFINVASLALVIIDESHHATKSHPMHDFLRIIQKNGVYGTGPRVIGLTGVLLKGNPGNNIQKSLNRLESVFYGKIITVRDSEELENVKLHSTKPIEKTLTYRNSCDHLMLLSKIRTIVVGSIFPAIENWHMVNGTKMISNGFATSQQPNILSHIKNLLNDFIYQVEDFGLYGASIAIMSPLIDFEMKKQQSETLVLRNLYRCLVSYCGKIRHVILEEIKKMDQNGKRLVAQTKSNALSYYDNFRIMTCYSTKKLFTLLLYLYKVFKNKKPEDISGLIFVERRYSAKCLYYIIKKFIAEVPHLAKIIKPQFMVGRNSVVRGIDFSIYMDLNLNKTAIEDFRAGRCNLIVCSSVLEEGIDVQACNFVVTYDPVKTYSSYIQTKGRARSKNSSYTMLVPLKHKKEFMSKINRYRCMQEYIQKYLEERPVDTYEPYEKHVANESIEKLPPFVIESGACLLASAALELVHRYCQTLPNKSGKDEITFKITNKKFQNKFQVYLMLPIESNNTEVIISEPFQTLNLCKMSVGLKACAFLYEHGKLNKHLLPITECENPKATTEELTEKLKNATNDRFQKYAPNYRRLYRRNCPFEFYDTLPVVGDINYAYKIEFRIEFEKNERNEHFVYFLKKKLTYAILVRKKLPPLDDMPLFMDHGKLSVRLSQKPLTVIIKNEQKLKLLVDFHVMIFRDIVKCVKSFYVLNMDQKQNSYIIVPLKNEKIDWEIVKRFPVYPPPPPPSSSSSSSLFTKNPQFINKCKLSEMESFHPANYLGNIIIKSVNDKNTYVVTKVMDKKAMILEKQNLLKYFNECKNHKSINDLLKNNQFLLEVRSLTLASKSFLSPKGISRKIRKSGEKIYLVPEKVNNLAFPGELWIKAIFLPNILQRVYCNFHEQFSRKQIINYFGYNKQNSFLPKTRNIDELLRNSNAAAAAKDYEEYMEENRNKEMEKDFKVEENNDESKGDEDDDNNDDYDDNIDDDNDNNAVDTEDDDDDLDVHDDDTEEDGDDTEENDDLKDYDDFEINLNPKLKYSNFNIQLLEAFDTEVKNNFIMNSRHNLKKNFHDKEFNNLPLELKNLYENLTKNYLFDAENTNTNTNMQNPFDISKNKKIISHEREFLFMPFTTINTLDVADMEKYEVLGDSFLKFSISLLLANKMLHFDEGILTELKSKIVSNHNLLYCLLSTTLPNKICNMYLMPGQMWLPPLFSMPKNILEFLELCKEEEHVNAMDPKLLNKIKVNKKDFENGVCSMEHFEYFVTGFVNNRKYKKSATQMNIAKNYAPLFNLEYINDKAVADTVESMLGIVLKTYGIHCAFRMLKYFGIYRYEEPISFRNLLKCKLLKTNIPQCDIDCFLKGYEALEKRLGYQFQDRRYLLQALTHPSYPTNRITGSYQELEYIGDAILDFLISVFIFENYTNVTPGLLTDLRSALVNNITLACICVRHCFHHFLLYASPYLNNAIRNFVEYQENHGHCVTSQVCILMEENDENDYEGKKLNISQNIDVPKALSDIIESIIAAVFLDSKDLLMTWSIIYRLLENEIKEFMKNTPIDPVRQLYEYKNAKPIFCRGVVKERNILIKCQFYCNNVLKETNGFGPNSKLAKKSAATHALQILRKAEKKSEEKLYKK